MSYPQWQEQLLAQYRADNERLIREEQEAAARKRQEELDALATWVKWATGVTVTPAGNPHVLDGIAFRIRRSQLDDGWLLDASQLCDECGHPVGWTHIDRPYTLAALLVRYNPGCSECAPRSRTGQLIDDTPF